MNLDGPTYPTLEQLIVDAAEGVRPPERLSVSQAAEKYRKLNNPGSYVGPWRNSKTPYMVEPMDTLASLDFTGLVFVGPARTGKSDSLAFNYITYSAICDPADMMFLHMTQNTARDWSQGDLARLFRHSPAVGEKLTPGRQNDNVHDKHFKNGMRLLIKWPTITELSAKTIPRLVLMDYDRMPDDVDKEGTPFDLARKRAQTFKRYGMCVAESSPGRLVENSKWLPTTEHEAPPTKGILSLYNRGDRRRWYWPCLQCGEPFEGDFKHLVYVDSKDVHERVESTHLVCPSCGFPHEPDMQDELNSKGKWRKEGESSGNPRRSDIASFWLKGPAAAFTNWRELVQKYLLAQQEYESTGSEEALKTTITTDQGLPYTPKSMQSDRLPEQLKDRAEDWGGSKDAPVVPLGCRFLIATIDVQARAFVVQITGFGESGDRWIVDGFKITRTSMRSNDQDEREVIDPAAYKEDWQCLVPEVIERTYPLADNSGRRMQVKMTGCDSGGREGVTTNAYEFWRWLRNDGRGYHRRFLLVKGDPKPGKARIQITYPDANRRDRHAGARGDVPVALLNSNQLKDQVGNMLDREEPGGMYHFPHWAEDWLYKQLTVEIRTEKGWENPKRHRNEAWDLSYYAEGIALHPTVRIETIKWDVPEKVPSWAAEWDRNDLVSSVTGAPRFVSRPKTDLSKLGESLA